MYHNVPLQKYLLDLCDKLIAHANIYIGVAYLHVALIIHVHLVRILLI